MYKRLLNPLSRLKRFLEGCNGGLPYKLEMNNWLFLNHGKSGCSDVNYIENNRMLEETRDMSYTHVIRTK